MMLAWWAVEAVTLVHTSRVRVLYLLSSSNAGRHARQYGDYGIMGIGVYGVWLGRVRQGQTEFIVQYE